MALIVVLQYPLWFGKGGWFSVLWVVGLVTALLTAFYMTRQVIMVFGGEARWQDASVPQSPFLLWP